jgi:hypothetical protein
LPSPRSDALRENTCNFSERVNPTVEALLAALVGVGLCVLWNVEHEHTSIRAPWTGLTLGASAAAFVAAGVVGRGWRAVVVCAAVVAGAAVLVEGFFLRGRISRPTNAANICGP